MRADADSLPLMMKAKSAAEWRPFATKNSRFSRASLDSEYAYTTRVRFGWG